MITKKEDLYGTHVLLSDKEAAEIYVGLINKLGISGISLGGHNIEDAIEVHRANWCRSGWDASFTKANENGLDVGSRRLTLSDLKPKRTRTEYEKVTESIFDLREEFERGELYCKHEFAREYTQIINTQTLAQALHGGFCFRKVEKEIDWRDESHRYLANKTGFHWSTPIAEVINDESDCFLELCRVALRANGEID